MAASSTVEVLTGALTGGCGGAMATWAALLAVPTWRDDKVFRRPGFYLIIAAQALLAAGGGALLATTGQESLTGAFLLGALMSVTTEGFILRSVGADQAWDLLLHRSLWVPLALLGIVVTMLSGWALTDTLKPDAALLYGVVAIVLLGASGLFLRGIGEEKRDPNLKAWGYYFGALAYMGTASVALYNGIPRLK